jgi:hypothetical protein
MKMDSTKSRWELSAAGPAVLVKIKRILASILLISPIVC